MTSKITYFKSTALYCVFTATMAFTVVNNAYAQSKVIPEIETKAAVKLAHKIKAEKLITENITSIDELTLHKLSPEKQLRHIRQYANGIIARSNTLNPKEVLETYAAAIKISGNQRDKTVFNLQKTVLENVNLSDKNQNVDSIVKKLEQTTTHEDWYVANNAWLLLSVLSSSRNNLNIALQQANEAYKIIPNEISPYVTDARIVTLTYTAYFNNFLLNPELAIENTVELIAQKQTAGYPIDGSSLLNNLLYSLSKWREHEVSTEIAQIVLEIEKEAGSNIPGLADLRVAQLYDQQSHFDSALIHIRKGLDVAIIPSIQEGLYFLEINSLAGLGRISEAKEKITALENRSQSEKSNDIYVTYMTRAKLGIAIAENNQSEIYNLTNKLLDINTQKLLRSYSSNTSNVLASLENTKDRQAEREASLEREANLQKAKAAQQKQTSQLLTILAILLAIAAAAALAFARYRDRISKELAIKTLEAEDADRMKSEFLGMISHELRTPLNGIVGIADLLVMQAPSEDLRRKAGIILDSSNKLTHVIESIVDMSAIDGNKMELYPDATNVYDIVADLDKIWRPKIEAKGITFTSFAERSLSEDLTLDPQRFQQCLDNLLSNAAKFTDKGRIHLHVTAEPIKDSLKTKLTAVIADTGQGMNETVQEKLFTPFLQADTTMTRKHGGSGLGLAITQSIARMMDGDVTMMSNEGRGSEFTMTVCAERSEDSQLLDDVEALMDKVEMTPLPSTDIPTTQNIDLIPNENITDNAFEAENLRGLRVLVVDSLSCNQEAIKAVLRNEGFEIQSVSNGFEALKTLNVQAMDIVVMDIRKPKMDGIETARTIRDSGHDYKNIPIIALTADTSAETNAACMAAGMDIFLAKPVKAKDLIESIGFIHRTKKEIVVSKVA